MKYAASIGFVLIASATSARAHAFLDHAAPAAGDSLRAAPKNLVLEYSETLEPVFSAVTIIDSSGHDVSAGRVSVAGNTMQLPLQPLKPGSYRVSWHALSIDTHRTEGTYSFSVSP